MPIERSDGINKSERYLKQLCDQTFLSLWSYPGVYSNEGLDRNKRKDSGLTKFEPPSRQGFRE